MGNLPRDKRIIHRQAILRPEGADGSAVATALIGCPPGRIVGLAVDYQNQPATTDIVIKADSSTGTTIFTRTSSATDIVPSPVGTTSLDETGAATAATDGFSGGFPVRAAVYIDVAQGDGQTSGDELIIVDLWIKLSRYERIELVAQSGADGTGAVTRTVNLNGAGCLAAVAVDYQNTPATADLLIKADDTNGQTLFTRTSSQTDLAPTCIGRPGLDEANGATAATDGTEGGAFFKRGLFLDLAETDIFTSGNEKTIVELWIDQ
jgi:hypothetical protein